MPSTRRPRRRGAVSPEAYEAAIGEVFPRTEGNRIEHLENGDRFFPPMLEAIERAEHTVTFLTYVYWKGEIARRFADALARASQRGVVVRVLLDAFGARPMPSELSRKMRDAGCEVAWFRPLRWFDVQHNNRRTHRKILVADGSVGFTGGAGIATEWTGDAQDPDHWRDDHFRIRGPVVRYLQEGFAENWLEARGEVLAGEHLYPELAPAGSAVAVPVLSGPFSRSYHVETMFRLLLRSARERLRLTSPYFVPRLRLHRELLRTARRGVAVDLLVPGDHNDSNLARAASRAYYPSLLRAGVRVWEYRPTMIHVKLAVADRRWAAIGSANFDYRSVSANWEVSLLVRDEALVATLADSFDGDLELARRIRMEDCRRDDLKSKLLARLAFLIRRLL